MSVNGMEITDVIIFPLKKSNNVITAKRAMARVVFNDQFVINGLWIIKTPDGYKVSYPNEFDENADEIFNYFPITNILRNYISDQVLMQYDVARHKSFDLDKEVEVSFCFDEDSLEIYIGGYYLCDVARCNLSKEAFKQLPNGVRNEWEDYFGSDT